MTIIDMLNRAQARLAEAGIADARRDAELLLCSALGRDRAWLFAHIRDILDEGAETTCEVTVKRRAAREPLQYITGKQEFWGLDFRVTPAVLIPRPETEFIVESALKAVPDRSKPVRIIDLCTGSGCIAISLARELSGATIIAIDISSAALNVARENAGQHGVFGRIRFLQGDLFKALGEDMAQEPVDIITANPPYVPAALLNSLQPEVKDFEPGMALVAGPEGNEFHQRIISESPQFLKHGGKLIMEMGIGQSGKLIGLARESHAFQTPQIVKDLAGIDRVIILSKK